MKKNTQFLMLIIVLSSCFTDKQQFDFYGNEISSEDAISTAEFIAKVSDTETKYKIKGKIEEVCQMKGCWMTLKNEHELNVRVTFKDYGFFVPKDISGSEVIIEGVAFKELLDEDVARHYAEDGNKVYDESMRSTISFVASGVLVAKN